MPPQLDAAALVQAHQAGVWRYLRCLGCSAVEAEDLAQETFLAVLRRPFDDFAFASTAGYLRRVARNLFLKQRARAARGPALAEVEALDATFDRWCGDDGGGRYLEALRACLATLDAAARSALERHYRDGASRAELARALRMSEDGIKSMMRRARASLRACVERKVQE
jgi:RNA polymerase sigma-70 factor (ECF subfamily)